MQLTDIELAGFKSFAKPTHLRFDVASAADRAGITAIIGPNGSGKSNLAEAIRWVLGEQSKKELRAETSQDVIFSGSETQRKSSRAFVRLTFENEDGRFPVEAAQVSVSRSLTTGGESEYAINGEPVRLLDLQQLLAQAGIGTKTYTVISQGTVDRYLTAAPEARRELFDEATGIKSLQLKLKQAEQKLERSRRHAEELQQIVQELTPRLTILKRQAQKYQQREEIQTEYAAKLEAYLRHRWHEANQTLERLRLEAEAARQTAEAARGQREQLEQALFTQAPVADMRLPLETKLAAAQAEQARQQVDYDNALAEQKQLTDSLVIIEQELAAAEKTLHELRQESLQFDWVKRTRLVLKKCLTLLGLLQSRQTMGAEELESLADEVKHTLGMVEEDRPIEAARSLLQHMEKPLQEVARLTAIRDERRQQLKRLADVPQPSTQRVEELEAELSRAGGPHHTLPGAREDISQQLAQARDEEVAAERADSAVSAAIDQAAAEVERLRGEILREAGSHILQEPGPAALDENPPQEDEIRSLAQKLAALGEIDPLILKEYEEVAARYQHLTDQLNDAYKTADNLGQVMLRLRQDIQATFVQQFTVIARTFAEYVQHLFGGGKASLTVTAEGGVEISVTPPGKRPRHVHSLSGGEKALTSLALLLAILEAQRPPFIVLDEVDAALDEANSRRFAEIVRAKSLQTQVVLITHNRETMGQADILYGVTMQRDGVSKVYSVKLSDVTEIGGVENKEEISV